MSVVGSPVRLTATFRNTTGASVDPDVVTAHLTLPDGTALSLAAVKDSVGSYHLDYTPVSAGIHQFYFAGTGVNASIQNPDIFTVTPTSTGALISLADARQQLNMTYQPPAGSTDDAEILGFIHAASSIINHVCGFTTATVFSEWVTPSWGSLNSNLDVYGSGYTPLVLSRTPVLAVTAVQPQFYGVGLVNVGGLIIDGPAGIVQMPASQLFLGPCLVTYTAGRTSVPTVLQIACRLIVQSLWETQRGPAFGAKVPFGNRGNLDGEEMVDIPGMAVAIPARAYELMMSSGHTAAPGFA